MWNIFQAAAEQEGVPVGRFVVERAALTLDAEDFNIRANLKAILAELKAIRNGSRLLCYNVLDGLSEEDFEKHLKRAKGDYEPIDEEGAKNEKTT